MTARVTRSGWPGLVLDAWVVVLAALLCWPLLAHGGYPLARDLVFTPRQPMTADALGLGSAAPRAVPLDGLVWLLERLVDGAVLARLAVPGALLVAGWGAHRLVRARSLPARVLVAGFAVWNPFVVERLALGQWALLWSYAAAYWLVAAAARHRAGGPLWPVVGWLAVSSITPTGGVIGSVLALVIAADGRSRAVRVGLVAVALQLPWLVPSVLSAAGATSDPAGVGAFAARSERPGGALLSLLGLGGVWDSGSTPGSRGGALGYATTLLVLVVLVLGIRHLPRAIGSATAWRLVWLGGGGLVLAATSSVPGGDVVMEWAVVHLPGAGLLRDAQKWLLPFVVLVVVSLGALVDRARIWSRRGAGVLLLPASVLMAVLPVLLLPDGAATTWPTVRPVHYPGDFTAVRDALDRAPSGDVAVLPWRAYRLFSWGRPVSVYDPASRWFDRAVVTDDELRVGDVTLENESPRTREVARALAGGRPADVLGPLGVGYVLVYRDDPAAGRLDLGGLRPVAGDRYVELYAVTDPVRSLPGAPLWKLCVVVGADLVVLLGALSWVLAGVATGRSRRRRSASL